MSKRSFHSVSVLAIKRWNRKLFILVLIPFFVLTAFDSRSKLEKKKAALLKKIELTKNLLNKTANQKQSGIAELALLQKQIEVRKNLIRTMKSELQLAKTAIEQNETYISELEKEISDLKSSYADLIYYKYLHLQERDMVSFFFAAEDFNHAFQKVQYDKEIKAYRLQQIDEIREAKLEMEEKRELLEKRKQEHIRVLAAQDQQRSRLEKDQAVVDERISGLAKEEKKLKSDLEKQRTAAKKLDKQIKKLIEEEIRKQAALAQKTKPKDPGESNPKVKSPYAKLSPEGIKLSSAFEENRQRLPWPVSEGVMCLGFGKQLHPLHRNPPIYVSNNGIDICTSSGAAVRTIFSGKVVKVFSNPSFHKGVLINHGLYFTVYTNLKSVEVVSGDQVAAQQKIGIVHTDPKDGKTQVHFELWKGTSKLNPSLWLYRQ